MSERELIEQQIYWSIEPPLADRIELAIAQLTALTANINRDSAKHPNPFVVKDFLPQWGRELEPEEDDDGMAPERVMDVMEEMMAAQARREQLERRRKNGASSR